MPIPTYSGTPGRATTLADLAEKGIVPKDMHDGNEGKMQGLFAERGMDPGLTTFVFHGPVTPVTDKLMLARPFCLLKTMDCDEKFVVSEHNGLVVRAEGSEGLILINSVSPGSKVKPNVAITFREVYDYSSYSMAFELSLSVLHKIAAGEELLLDYGKRYWNSMAWRSSTWMCAKPQVVWALYEVYNQLAANPEVFGAAVPLKDAHPLAKFPASYFEGQLRAGVFNALHDVEGAMMQGKGYNTHMTETVVKVMRVKLSACYGETVAELFLRVLEMEIQFQTGMRVSVERVDAEGSGPQVLFALGMDMDPHYDAMSGNQWGVTTRLNEGTDTAFGAQPSLDIVQLFQEVMVLPTAQERAEPIAEAMIKLHKEILNFKPQPARTLPAGSFTGFRIRDNIHQGRGGIDRRTLFTVMDVSTPETSGQGPNSVQNKPHIVTTAEYPYKLDTFGLNSAGVSHVLSTLRAAYNTSSWIQGLPEEDAVMNKLTVLLNALTTPHI